MSKERSISAIKEERAAIIARKDNIISSLESESRAATDTENVELRGIGKGLADLEVELAAAEARQAQEGRTHQAGNKPAYSIRKAILEKVTGMPFSEDTAAMVAEGRSAMQHNGISTRGSIQIPIESRAALTATGSTDTGKGLILNDRMDLLMPLRDRMVMAQAGATFLTGLVGNLEIPKYSGTSVAWADENGASTDGAGTFSTTNMRPKRLTAVVYLSRQLLIQDSIGVEAMIRQDIVNAIGAKLESTILGSHAHAENTPDGLFTKLPTASGALTFDSIVKMETDLECGNALADNLCYIMHPALYGKAKTTVKRAAGAVGFIAETDGTMNGYKALRTNAMSKGLQTAKDEYGIAFANWADLIIGQWGALDLVIDEVTKADTATVRVIVNAYFDAGKRRDESFVVTTMK